MILVVNNTHRVIHLVIYVLSKLQLCLSGIQLVYKLITYTQIILIDEISAFDKNVFHTKITPILLYIRRLNEQKANVYFKKIILL